MRLERLVRLLGKSALACLVLAWLGSCSDGSGPCPDCPPPSQGLIVSNPVSLAAAVSRSGAQPVATGGGGSTVYVSLTPGSVPDAATATIHRVGDAATTTSPVVNGGFDPVPVLAHVGDAIDLTVTDARGVVVHSEQVTVAAARRPIVVRTEPPPRKRDVPLNATVVVVFSEPVNGGSLSSSSVQLLSGSTAIPGTVSLLPGYAATAVFEPSQPLEPNTDYGLVVTSSVRDLSGDALVAPSPVDFTTGAIAAGAPDHASVLPDAAALLIGSQLQLVATVRDSYSVVIPGQPVYWSSDNSTAAIVSSSGLVTAKATGMAHVSASLSASSLNYAGTATVIVSSSLAPVDSVAVTPESTTVPVGPAGGSIRLTAVMRDAAGTVLPYRTVTWQSSNPTIATVSEDAGGRAWVLGVAPGTAIITATSEGHSGSATITFITPGPFAAVAPGSIQGSGSHTCGVTTDTWLLCWGGNLFGHLGTGAVEGALAPMGVGGLRFSQVSTRSPETDCGLIANGAAYCWGENFFGTLGIGSRSGPEGCQIYTDYVPCSREPVAVLGGHQFSAIGVGMEFVCGLALDGKAFCWGFNDYGQLGAGIPAHINADTTLPVAVSGSLIFTSLTVGFYHACGLTPSGAAYCWGANSSGQLGDSTGTDRTVPVRVVGGLLFTSLTAGVGQTCGLTSDSSAYCWGQDYSSLNRAPTRVAGGLRFSTITAGISYTGGLVASGTAYCWGGNDYGQLGIGSTTAVTAPTAVSGGLTFASLIAGQLHTCGVTTGGVAYCWGDNTLGQLGDGSTTSSLVPVKVAGQP